VAIKKVAEMFQDLVDAKRILREVKLLRHLDGHQNVVGIRDLMTQPPDTLNFDDVYIVTDLFECDLDRIISSTQPLTDAHNQYFIYQVRCASPLVGEQPVLASEAARAQPHVSPLSFTLCLSTRCCAG
jgi:mitogen-activated protein kinase 1/3|tara:strand:- start:717 stop:1100 length:384 start_codon:yes stop_codon:yes gene_type:complete